MIRWERLRGLPIYRVPGGKLSRVFAYPDELEQWLANRSKAESLKTEDAPTPRRLRWIIVAVAAAIVTALAFTGIVASRRDDNGPRRLVVIGNEVQALDGAGRMRWAHRLDVAAARPGAGPWEAVGDVDGDQLDDILVTVTTKPRSSTAEVDALLHFSGDGKLRWSRSPDDRIRFRIGEYGPPWSSADIRIYRAGDEPRIAWAAHHFTWWPGLLLTLDARGERVATFVNSGWIGSVTSSHDIRHLLLSGMSNARNAYFFAALDAERPEGHSPEPPGSPFECLDCPTGAPIVYYVFPRSDISQRQEYPQAAPSVRTHEDGTVEIHVLESGGPNIATTIYELGADLTVRGARFGDSYWEWHQRLEQEGRLDHSADDCPHRHGLEVQRWTLTAGWQTLHVAAQ